MDILTAPQQHAHSAEFLLGPWTATS